MTLDEFSRSLADAQPPAGLSRALTALWWAGKGDWEQSHLVAQEADRDPENDLVHAWLHRQEGDLGNAGYWYRRAGRTMPTVSLEAEWQDIAAEFLAR